MHFFGGNLLLLHIRRVHVENPRRTVLGEVHPVSAQNKTLISDTVTDYIGLYIAYTKPYT